MLSLVQRKALYTLGAGMALGLMTMSAQAGPSAGGLKLEADAMPVQRVAYRGGGGQVAGPGRHFRHIQNRRRIQSHIQIQRHIHNRGAGKPSPPYGVGYRPPDVSGITPRRVGYHPRPRWPSPGHSPPPVTSGTPIICMCSGSAGATASGAPTRGAGSGSGGAPRTTRPT